MNIQIGNQKLKFERTQLGPEGNDALSKLYALFPEPGIISLQATPGEMGGGLLGGVRIHGSVIPGMNAEVFAEMQALCRVVDRALARVLRPTLGTWYLPD